VSYVPKGFLWGALAFCALLIAVPQLFTRNKSWEKIFDTREGEDAFVNRGLRIAFFGVTLFLVVALYNYPKA
jgi:hypothetical protein